MFNRIRNYFLNRRVKKKTNSTIRLLQTAAPPSPTVMIFDDAQSNTLTFTNNNGVKIFSIEPNGEAVWHKEDVYNEAASIFLQCVTMNIEDKAGIAQNRMEWEERITVKLARQAEIAPLGPEELTDVIRKCIMYDKLKGTKN